MLMVCFNLDVSDSCLLDIDVFCATKISFIKAKLIRIKYSSHFIVEMKSPVQL